MRITIRCDDDAGYWMILQDGCGIAKTKSKTQALRIRDALNAVFEDGLCGLTVENTTDNIPARVDGYPRAVVLALTGMHLVVRKPDDKLDVWAVADCRIVSPGPPDKETVADDPPNIYIYGACELLRRFIACGVEDLGKELADVALDAKTFLALREREQPTF